MARKRWFDDKTEQVTPATLKAFGIRIESRYGDAEELVEMLEFCGDAAVRELEQHIESIFYDSKANLCSFKVADGLEPESPEARELLDIAHQRVRQFMWIDDGVYHGRGFEEP